MRSSPAIGEEPAARRVSCTMVWKISHTIPENGD